MATYSRHAIGWREANQVARPRRGFPWARLAMFVGIYGGSAAFVCWLVWRVVEELAR